MIGRVVAAATLAAAAYAALPAAPAVAAACSTGAGVSVVVDFHELGGGVQSACVAGGGGDKASTLFPAAGFALDYVQRQPGFVCRVSGKPAESPCVNTPPADAYWGLWWSDGESGRWTYATTGVGGLSVPDGGSVALSWKGSEQSSPPGTAPPVHQAQSQPSQQPTQQPGHQPTQQPGHQPTRQPSAGSTGQPTGHSSSGSTGPEAQPSTGPGSSSSSGRAGRSGSPAGKGAGKGDRARGQRTASAEPGSRISSSPSPSGTDAALEAASADPPEAGEGGLPVWVAPIVLLLLFGAAGGVALARRRTSGPA